MDFTVRTLLMTRSILYLPAKASNEMFHGAQYFIHTQGHPGVYFGV